MSVEMAKIAAGCKTFSVLDQQAIIPLTNERARRAEEIIVCKTKEYLTNK